MAASCGAEHRGSTCGGGGVSTRSLVGQRAIRRQRCFSNGKSGEAGVCKPLERYSARCLAVALCEGLDVKRMVSLNVKPLGRYHIIREQVVEVSDPRQLLQGLNPVSKALRTLLAK
eukprot:scaffold837_cov416-Prasinococcus_capsulatus_cf.AAC.14